MQPKTIPRMPQPIPKKIANNNPEFVQKPYNTLLIDGSNLLEVCFRACRQFNSDDVNVGAVFEFLLQVKLLLRLANFRHVYCFFDGTQSGLLRYQECADYKANRDKTFSDAELSDYMKEVNAMVRVMMSKAKQKKPNKTPDEFEDFSRQRDIVIQCLEELFVRVVMCDYTEADDCIGYYVSKMEPNERVVICSNDRDLTQLISDRVIIYMQSRKCFVNRHNHKELMGYDYHNVVLKKVICGDVSDNIKGIKGVGEKTLFDNFPEIRDREVALDEVISKAKLINEERVSQKKKPLRWAENIVNKVTDSVTGERIYEINRKIIDLSDPLMPDDAKELLDMYIHMPMDPDGRSFENLYRILSDNKIDNLTDDRTFSNFFTEYKNLEISEKNFFRKFSEK